MRLTGRQVLVITLGWILFGCLHGTQMGLGILAESPEFKFSFTRFVAWQVGCWLVWAALTPEVIWLSRRFPLAPRVKTVALHLGASIVFALVHVAGIVFMSYLVEPFGPEPTRPWITDY